MISIVCWLWHDAGLQGPKTPHVRPHRPMVRSDLIPRAPRGALREERRRLREAFLNGRRDIPTGPARAARFFLPEHVNTLQRAIARNLPEPHRFICITDSTEGFAPEVEVIKTPASAARLAELRTPEGPRFPSCYRRLWTFSDEARILGERVLVLDIDAVPTADLRPLFAMKADFVGWRPFRDWGKRLRFGGGIYLLTPGTRTAVWTEFTGPAAIQRARAAGFRGSDQAWISYKLAEREPYWPNTSGIYSVRDLGPGEALPKDARLVQFNGHKKPWAYPGGTWVAAHWR
ncbi:MAG: hypothetical protein KAY22_05510 [Rhizorhabdus sp.]|uniref:hypothetical protein n=1 Tax=Rhizorhabdus sp. TaxID=1968843 RepID=UPI001B65AE4A|nr:hypothetical protein [Rhizorhabdus sp.]MBP8231742.1 hypothetical protein [Rhizorhabdus sp.]